MDELTVKKRIWLLGTMIFLVFLAWWPEFGGAKLQAVNCVETELCVAFLDVGQGDAIFIQTPNGTQLLLDGGPDDSVLRELSALMEFRDRTLDFILMTHPDSDHVSGMASVLNRYDVENIIRTNNESDTEIWQEVEGAIVTEGAQVFLAERGQRYRLDDDIFLDILFPNVDPTNLESNASSVIARLVYGETEFMLTGDAPQAIEEYLILLDETGLQSDVLKVGHHGSRTSTAPEFVAAVAPDYAVISAGADNSYGHPHRDVTETLQAAGVQTFSTAEMGTVVFSSDSKLVRLLQH